MNSAALRDPRRLDPHFSARFHGLVRMRAFKWLVLPAVLAGALVLASARGRAEDRNKCGCYKDGATCYCDKQAKCGCPGECEPKGCEEKRERELQKEIEAETRKASSGHAAAGAGKKTGGEDGPAEEKAAARGGKAKLTAAQAKQLAKLIDLFLAEHPEARSRPLGEVRSDLNP